MNVGSTPYSSVPRLYSKLATNPYSSKPIKSAIASGSIIDVTVGKNGEVSAGKKNGIITGSEKPLSVGDQQQKQRAEMYEKIAVDKMLNIERQVTSHEQAHKAVAGQFAGPISYDYVSGPDGKKYIVGGDVPIYAPEGRSPEETIQIMERVKRAALAPADPSAQDVSVAAQAAQIQMAARAEMSAQSAQMTEQKDYVTSFPLKGKITQISEYNPYSQPIEELDDEVQTLEPEKKQRMSVLENLTQARRSQLNQASMDLASQTTILREQNDTMGANLVSYEKYKNMVQHQRNYSSQMSIILDVVA